MDDIAALVEPHIPALRRYAWVLIRDDDKADDLVQDCLERAIGGWHLRKRDGNLRAWLIAILRNRFLSGMRQVARRGRHLPLDELTSPLHVEADQEQRLRLRDVLSGLDELPDEQRSVLLLVAMEDLSYEDAAQILGLPVGTVMSRLSRGRARLRRHLDSGGPAVLRRVK